MYRLRALLMHAGVLTERAYHLERIVPWMAALLAEQPAAIAQPIETWMRWRVLRRARRRTEHRPFTRPQPTPCAPRSGPHYDS